MLLKTDLRIVVSTYAGLEKLLAKELVIRREMLKFIRAVSCVGDKGFMYKVNFCSRLALRVMVSYLLLD